MLALGKAGVAGAGAPVAARLAASPIPVVGAPGNICRTRLWPEGAAALPLAALTLVVAGQMVLQSRLQALAGPVYMSQIGAVAAVTGTLIAAGATGETLPQGFLPAALLIAAGAGAFQRARRVG